MRRDVSVADHLAPQFGLSGQELRRVSGRAADRIELQLAKLGRDVVLSEQLGDVSADLLGERRGRAGGGAAAANHDRERNPGSVSAMAGTSGKARARCSLPTPMILAVPARCSGNDVTMVSNIMSTWPATISVSACAAPR